jgi:hypothetical protein
MVQCLLNTREISGEELDELKKIIAAHEQANARSTRQPKSGKKGLP